MSRSLIVSLWAWMPELCLSVGAGLVLLLGVFARRRVAAIAAAWTAWCLAAASLWVLEELRASPAIWPNPLAVFSGLIAIDHLGAVFRWIALGVLALVMFMATSARDVEESWTGEYLGLLLFVGVGLMLMAEATHLLMAVVSIELVSLSAYCLVALTRDARSSEAGLKYLLFGALSSGIMLFGISLLYGLTGELAFSSLNAALARLGPAGVRAASVAAVFVLAGLAFKISMVPFHMWTPDVYEGAPIAVAALLSVGPKAAGLALLVRLAHVIGPVWVSLQPVIMLLAVLTMTLGNVVALLQTNVKRLLAYSTIGQVGYLLIGFAVGTRVGLEAILVYLVAYLFMNLGAFACAAAVHRETGSESLDAFRGLAGRAPALALSFSVFLLSLAGIPPLVGFVGKFLLFGAAIEAHALWLAVAGAVNSAIALYYYVNLLRLMYLHTPDGALALRPGWSLRVAVGICATATLWLGLFPGGLLVCLQRVAVSSLL